MCFPRLFRHPCASDLNLPHDGTRAGYVFVFWTAGHDATAWHLRSKMTRKAHSFVSAEKQPIGNVSSWANENGLTHMIAHALACQAAWWRGTCIGFAAALSCERSATFA